MKKKRSSFWTVVFAFLPGAGHMYMGLMKMGISFMAVFFGVIAISDLLDFKLIAVLTPIIWFYSFFDCINKRFSSDEDFEKIEDRYMFSFDKIKAKISENKNSKLILGVVLIVLGLYIMLINFAHQLNAFFPGVAALENIISPRVLASIAIIAFGVWLIVGKRKGNGENV